MATIIILGLKLPFRSLWKKIGEHSRLMCTCNNTPNAYVYCPYCGVKKESKIIKIYRSRLTGDETLFRNTNTLIPFLHANNLDIYDSHPRGYTDDPVYIYFVQPSCSLRVTSADPVNMAVIHQQNATVISDRLRALLGDELWSLGEFGLWAFTAVESGNSDSSEDTTPPLAFEAIEFIRED